ncbi:DUF3604 domain-containing protein [Neptunicella sp.]|uniref:DUF3604 domain-containing protein n=1 Tax=Neptunicella sp. TaxID=2125986 RepID=UPI003F69251D
MAQKKTVAVNPIRNAYFGDLHIHTRHSYDAYLFNVRTSPDDAYNYAKGKTIKHPLGYDLKLHSPPLDFLAVTDHAEYLGVLAEIATPGTEYSKVPYAKDLFSTNRKEVLGAFSRFVNSMLESQVLPEFSDTRVTKSAWQDEIDSAERHNNPGVFTTFVGYEFTSLPGKRNLHRNVIFANNKVPELPYTALDSQNPEDLWRWLDKLRAQGIDSLAIPHNSNASDGTMFERTMWNGQPIDEAYAQLRARNEPLVEVSQVKGQSETMPLLSPNDEFAGFELMTSYIGSLKPITKFAGGYVRDALKRGLEIENTTGVNPYKLGFVSGSDGHDSAGPYEEDNYFSKAGVLDGTPAKRGSVPGPEFKDWNEYYADGRPSRLTLAWGSAGLAGVWAESNTRESLFSAMRRKETFSTTGPRIKVRLFAGKNLNADDLTTAEGLARLYANGVPMGGEIVNVTNTPLNFVVMAIRDVNSAPLQRVQIIKGWLDSEGQSHEKVYDVACSDNGSINPETHRCADNGAAVNTQTCEMTQGVGDAELRAQWLDPEFDAAQRAFYYARVLENPTCRWSTWDAIRANSEPNPNVAKTVQERAYTSPIWFEPADE